MNRMRFYPTDPGYVYIIRLGKKEENKWYVGFSQDIEQRIKQHIYAGQLKPEKQGNLCGLMKFPTGIEAYATETWLHSMKRYHCTPFFEVIVTLLGGSWNEEEINC
jgi:predicted GIY-YIG superfamily endonuclease